MALVFELAHRVKEIRGAEWEGLAIDDLWLDNLFLSVRLSDGAVGLALNYDQEGPGVPAALAESTRSALLLESRSDPLLWSRLTRPSDSHAQTALLVAVLAALSAPILIDERRLSRLGWKSSEGRIPLASFRHLGTPNVTVVGGGGYLAEAMRQDWLAGLTCSDFNFANPEFRRANPTMFARMAERGVSIDDGRDTERLIAQADIICLTASTLCNGSLEHLLPQGDHGKVVIVEGPSGGVLPGPLFERGVTHLVHNPVDVDYLVLSKRYSRHCAKGLMSVPSGRFLDLLLPEQRTVRGQTGLSLEGGRLQGHEVRMGDA
jgi:hypothetical protein